jgi:hypothetical protein
MNAENPAPADVAEVASQGRARRRWRWLLAAMLLLLIVLHVPLLRACGRALMAEAPAQGGYDAALILGGDHRLQAAAELVASGQVERIWLIDGRPDYLVVSGILPAGVEVLTDRLTEAGVAFEQIDVLRDPEVDDLPDAVRLLRTHLAAEPEVRLLVICGALSGRHVRFVLNDVLEPQVASRTAILGLPYDRFDVDQWWKSRSGLKQVFSELCSLGFTLAVGTQPQAAPPLVEAEAIEKELRRRFGEAACYER